MASLVSEALAGFGFGSGGKTQNAMNESSPHYHFIHSTLMPTVVKIQKELRGRKFKQVQDKLQETIMGLQTFQFQNWPPQQEEKEQVVVSPSSKSSPKRSISLEDHFENSTPQAAAAEEEKEEEDLTDTESTMGDVSLAPQDDDLRPFDEQQAKGCGDDSVTTTTTVSTTASSTTGTITTTTTTTAAVVVEDDPQTREPMHQSIRHALEAFIMVMQHPNRTNKACEYALECVTQLTLKDVYISGRAGGKDDTSASGAGQRTNEQQPQQSPSPTPTPTPTSTEQPSLIHKLVQGIHKCSESNNPQVQSAVIESFKALLTNPKCGIHEATMLLAIRSIFHIYLVTKSTTIQQEAKLALMEMVRWIIQRMEEETKIAGLFFTDSYYLMRSLVKLSSKALPGIDDDSINPSNFLNVQFLTTTTVDPLALHNKVLSLELILCMMECAGPAICLGDKFVHLVQSQLCVALLKNCMSNHTQVAFLSQKIFLVLVYKFKAHLKDEIQVFMSNIFLRVLDSENSSFPQKALVLESLRSLCNDPLLLTQIFLNYDCDFDSMNLYKDIVFHLTKLSGRSNALSSSATTSYSTNSSSKTKEEKQQAELGLAGVEVLVTILQAFLRALGMPVENEADNDTAGKKIRRALDLEEIAQDLRLTATLLQTTTAADGQQQDAAAAAAGIISEGGELNVEDLQEHQQQQQIHRASSSPAVLLQESTSSIMAGKIVDAFDRKRNAEQNFELGAVKFTLSIKSGLNFFVDNGFCQLDAKDIAQFFIFHKDKLDKTQMGEVLGKEPDAAFVKNKGVTDPDKGGPGFFVRILHHYVDALDFTDWMFDDAIRLFLSGFRLPGEAQKIDRIMEKFAERFTRQNLEIFPSADTAFILAFSVIMLNTDLHNPSIKPERRMTEKGFISNNRGIGANGTDLPEDFLIGIFQRIKVNPFSLKEDDAAREKAEALDSNLFSGDGPLGLGLMGQSAEERKKEKFKKEREEMMSATEQLIRRRRGKQAATMKTAIDNVAPADVVKPMFDVTWGPIIGILSQVLECSNDERSIAVCLNGFVYAIRIAAHSNMSLARDTFINSLAKFTLLGAIKEMKHKNIESIRTLLNIAVADGEYLGECWGPVLQCVSRLARMRMSASGLGLDESFLSQAHEDENMADVASADASLPPSKRGSSGYWSKSQSKIDMIKETATLNEKVVLETFGEQLIDNVFQSTVKLSANSLAHFIEQIVAVSYSEIDGVTQQGITGVATSAPNKGKMGGSAHGGEDGPSIFSLQRLVEVADYNMDVRPRIVWTKVWGIIAEYFSKIGCHRNAMVSVFAIDSLKQLSSKFLEKPELSEFKFQRIFLQPFLTVMQNPGTRQDIRELILECMNQLISTRAHNLQSGWKIFFDVLMASARDSNERVMLLALNILQRMLDENRDQLCPIVKHSNASSEEAKEEGLSTLDERGRNSNAGDFIDMCLTSISFVQLKDSEESPRPVGVSMRALCHTAIYADFIAEGRVLPPVSGAQTTDPNARGYTYGGLTDSESLRMVLWRPLLDGLARGVRSTARSRAGGVGCLVQRGSVLAIRAILLRHGSLFSVKELEAILRQTIIPAFKEAAENDQSPVISITSESPVVSSLDFLVEPMPLPPARYDRALLKFEEVARSIDCAPTRPLGPAELLLEACFTDMRHGGTGDLTEAYKFAKKNMRHNMEGEQPFPDSWIATTGPVALGCLTDILSEVIISHGIDGVQKLWPLIGNLMQQWCNGDIKRNNGVLDIITCWTPCEALVRIASREINRFSSRLTERLPHLEPDVAAVWTNILITFFSETLTQSLDLERSINKKLIKDKLKAYRLTSPQFAVNGVANEEPEVDEDEIVDLATPYGRGLLVDRRTNHYDASDITIDVIKLDFGFLYSPKENSLKTDSQQTNNSGIIGEEDLHGWVKLVPKMKIRCVAAHFLQQSIYSMNEESLTPFLEEGSTTALLNALNRSRDMAESAAKNEDLALAFQEATLSDWGLDEELGEEALVNVARLSVTQGSAMFFMTQTAGATKAVIKVLSALYDFEGVPYAAKEWDREAFAAPHLLEIMKDVLSKFVESEAKEGHRIDPNVWRNANESGVKVAVYCTSFAAVVVGLLQAMLSFDHTHIERQKSEFFPMICRLVRVQSEEIRHLVQRILIEKFGPMLGVTGTISSTSTT